MSGPTRTPIPPSWQVTAVVALGGAVGAVLRHGVGSVLPAGGVDGFPWATLLVNVLGSLLLGMALRPRLGPLLAAGLRTGVLGAFTTFSALSVETVALLDRGAGAQAALYLAGSVAAGVVAARLGAGRAGARAHG